MKSINLIYFVIGIMMLPIMSYAGYYIGDWGYRPCCGTGCYWFWADIYDDNGTNTISDDVFVGRARRLICGLSLQRLPNPNGDVGESLVIEDISKIIGNTIYDDITYEYLKKMENTQNLRDFNLYPNPFLRGEWLKIDGTNESDFPLTVTATNLSNQRQLEFTVESSKFTIPDWIENGIYHVIIKNKEGNFLLQTKIVIK
jgi:hypothetical protein